METAHTGRSRKLLAKALGTILPLKLIAVALLVISVTAALEVSAQTRLVLNGATINLNQGAYLVIDNPATNAIVRNSGHIISEGENNRIKWNMGTTIGTYVVPWGYGTSNYIPVSLTKSAGTGSGYFLFSTYHTAWNNASQLPTGINNINGANGSDNSSFIADRFWQVAAQGYTVKPDLTNLSFTYLDAENAAPNTITEGLLRAKRYNNTLNSWIDNLLTSSIDITTNRLTVASVDNANLHSWWTLGTLNTNRYWVAPSSANCNVSTNWSETSGGPGNAGVPSTGDAIFFDGSSNANCVLDGDLQVSGLTMSPSFGGTITQGPHAISVNGPATLSGGTFIGGSGTMTVHGNFTISGATFTAPSSTLEIKGNLAVTTGVFSHNNGTVLLSGNSGTQNISSSTALTFNNISTSNTSVSPGVSVQTNQNLKGVLTLADNVVFDADGSNNTSIFKLLSTGDSPTADAAVATLPPGAQVTGKVTVQRFMSKEGANNGRIYRYISSPIQNATVADLQQEIHVTGTFTGRSTCSGCVATSQSLFAYSEPVITDSDRNGTANLHDGYIDFPSNSNTEIFRPGSGYALYVRANLLTSALWDLRGPINSGNVTPVSFPVTFTPSGITSNDGWNLVGNPFPSTIDWNATSGWTKTNIENAIYITDNGSEASLRFATWNGVVGTNGGSRHIAIGQGFWVKANGNGVPVLQASETVKAAGTQTTFFREESPSNLLRITVSQGKLRDETVIHFREDATAEFDNHADARKFANSALNLSSILNDGQYVAINSLASLDCEKTIPLTIENVASGNYKFEFTEYESFPSDINIYLKDNFIDSVYNIRNGSYNFSVTNTTASFGASRFEIQFGSIVLNHTLNVTAADVCEGNDIRINIESPQAGVLYTALLDSLIIPAEQHDGLASISISRNQLKSDTNKIIVRSSAPYCSSVVEKEILVNVKPLITPGGESTSACGEHSFALVASGGLPNGLYNWYEDETSITPIEGQHGAIFQTPLLKKTKTYYVSAINSLGCEGERVAVKAVIIYLDEATIIATNGLLQSSYPTGNQWFFNGEIMNGETGVSIKPKQSGLYKTVVTLQGCVTTGEIHFTVAPVVPQPDDEPVSEEEQEEEEEVTDPEETHETPSPETPIAETPLYDIVITPNPVLDLAIIEISNTFRDVSKVMIFNSNGQFIRNIVIEKTDNKSQGTIDLSDHSAGIYYLQIFTSNGVHKRKLIKR